MKNFLYNYGWIIAVIVAFLVKYYITYKKQGTEQMYTDLKKDVLALMLNAEEKFGAKTGKIKFAWVVNNFYNILPDTMKNIWTQEDIEKYVQNTFDYAKKYLEN